MDSRPSRPVKDAGERAGGRRERLQPGCSREQGRPEDARGITSSVELIIQAGF